MSRKKVIVKRLNSIQNFGGMDVLCSDKTSTLTEDRVVLQRHARYALRSGAQSRWALPRVSGPYSEPLRDRQRELTTYSHAAKYGREPQVNSSPRSAKPRQIAVCRRRDVTNRDVPHIGSCGALYWS